MAQKCRIVYDMTTSGTPKHSPAVLRQIRRDAHEQELQVTAEKRRNTPPTTTPVTEEKLLELLSLLVEGTPFEGPVSTDGRTILVDVADPTAPDGLGRTFYLTITETPR
jgi:hypothetical protein